MAENPEEADKSVLSPSPRRGHVGPERAAEPDHRDQIASLADSVKRLASQLSADGGVETPPETTVRRKQKFQRAVNPNDPRADAPGGTEASPADKAAADDHLAPSDDPPEESLEEQESIDDSARNMNIAWPRSTRKDLPVPARPRRQRRSTTVPMLVLLGCNLFLLILGFVVGQSAATGDKPAANSMTAVPRLPKAADALEPQSANEREMAAVNNALHAEKTSDLGTARRLYNESIQRRSGIVGAEYRLALLAIQRGDLIDADLHLARSTAAGECVAPCGYVRATFAGAQGNYAEAGRQLEAATRAEPFNAKYFFCWAESLRRQGKPHAAVDVLKQALDRAYSPEEGDLYFFKLGLAKIEAGADDDFNNTLAQHLHQPSVPGDWLLLAAAQDLDRAAYPAAADHLQKAEQAMGKDLFESRVRDYFFHTHAKEPEVAAYLDRPIKPGKTEAGASIMDPATWSPEKADPGAWPSSGSSR